MALALPVAELSPFHPEPCKLRGVMTGLSKPVKICEPMQIKFLIPQTKTRTLNPEPRALQIEIIRTPEALHGHRQPATKNAKTLKTAHKPHNHGDHITIKIME